MSRYVVGMKQPTTSCPQLWLFSPYFISQPMMNIEVVFFINYSSWRSVLMMDNTFPIKNTLKLVLILLQLFHTTFGRGEPGTFYWDNWVFISGSQLQMNDSSPLMTILRKSGSLIVVRIKSLAIVAQCSFCSSSKSCGTNFASTRFMLKSCIKISDIVDFQNPQISFQFLHCQSLIFVDCGCTHSTLSGVLLVAGLPEHRSLSTDS